MAMLAEPKRKVKYGSDPRNTAWSNDKNKFGMRMLESMGWKEGRGLGAKEDGMTEHIKAVHRTNDDVRGVGCSKNYADNWIAHQDDFNAILSSLNESVGESTAAKEESSVTEKEKLRASLEAKSKSSRTRVHYHKFTRGKDLSSRSSEDLDCIFGRRKGQASETSTPTLQSEANSDAESDADQPRASFHLGPSVADSSSAADTNATSTPMTSNVVHGLNFTTSKSSIGDYFAKKMAELKQNREGNGGAGLNKFSNSASSSSNNSDSNEDEGKHTASNNASESVSDNVSESVSDSSETGSKKSKKKKKKDKQVKESGEGVVQGKENHVIVQEGQTGEEDTPKKKKKKDKKRKRDDAEGELKDVGGQKCTEAVLEALKSEKKKKRRKRKEMDSGNEESGQQPVEETVVDEVDEPKKKKKKRKSIDDGLLNADDERLPEQEQGNGEKTSETKKKKQKSVESLQADNGCDGDDVADSSVNEPPKKSKKKKKKNLEVNEDETEREAPLNASILRVSGEDAKSKLNKSVSFCMSDNEVFIISPIKKGEAAGEDKVKEKVTPVEEEAKDEKSPKKKKRTKGGQDDEKMEQNAADMTEKNDDSQESDKSGKPSKKRKRSKEDEEGQCEAKKIKCDDEVNKGCDSSEETRDCEQGGKASKNKKKRKSEEKEEKNYSSPCNGGFEDENTKEKEKIEKQSSPPDNGNNVNQKKKKKRKSKGANGEKTVLSTGLVKDVRVLKVIKDLKAMNANVDTIFGYH